MFPVVFPNVVYFGSKMNKVDRMYHAVNFKQFKLFASIELNINDLPFAQNTKRPIQLLIYNYLNPLEISHYEKYTVHVDCQIGHLLSLAVRVVLNVTSLRRAFVHGSPKSRKSYFSLFQILIVNTFNINYKREIYIRS